MNFPTYTADSARDSQPFWQKLASAGIDLASTFAVAEIESRRTPENPFSGEASTAANPNRANNPQTPNNGGTAAAGGFQLDQNMRFALYGIGALMAFTLVVSLIRGGN